MICCQYTMHFELKQSTICTNMRDVKTWVSANSIVGKTYDIINVIEDGLGNKLNGISMVIVGFFFFGRYWGYKNVNNHCHWSLSPLPLKSIFLHHWREGLRCGRVGAVLWFRRYWLLLSVLLILCCPLFVAPWFGA